MVGTVKEGAAAVATAAEATTAAVRAEWEPVAAAAAWVGVALAEETKEEEVVDHGLEDLAASMASLPSSMCLRG